jgi:hypothetical protein
VSKTADVLPLIEAGQMRKYECSPDCHQTPPRASFYLLKLASVVSDATVALGQRRLTA